MLFLLLSEVMDLHKKLIDQFGGIHGVRDKGLLESAIHHPKLCYSIQMERDLYSLAASYAYHLIHNHPFIDGNKRTGILAMLTFLRLNKIEVHIPKDELYNLGINIATSKIKEKNITLILKRYSVQTQADA